jgi:hypothetical protein
LSFFALFIGNGIFLNAKFSESLKFFASQRERKKGASDGPSVATGGFDFPCWEAFPF